MSWSMLRSSSTSFMMDMKMRGSPSQTKTRSTADLSSSDSPATSRVLKASTMTGRPGRARRTERAKAATSRLPVAAMVMMRSKDSFPMRSRASAAVETRVTRGA